VKQNNKLKIFFMEATAGATVTSPTVYTIWSSPKAPHFDKAIGPVCMSVCPYNDL